MVQRILIEDISGHRPKFHNWRLLSLPTDSHSITMEQVRETVKRIPVLRGISPEKIRDKVRSYFRENNGENSDCLSLPAQKESLGSFKMCWSGKRKK